MKSNKALERTGEVTRRPQVLGQFGGAWGSSGGWIVAGPLSLVLFAKQHF